MKGYVKHLTVWLTSSLLAFASLRLYAAGRHTTAFFLLAAAMVIYKNLGARP